MSHYRLQVLLVACFVFHSATSAYPPPGRRARGTITCTTSLDYRFGKGGSYAVKGPSLTSHQYAPWDEKEDEHYGDVVFFHANGCVMPDIQPEFFLSIAYRVCDRIKQGYPEPLCVYIKLGDNRKMGSGVLFEAIDFDPGMEYSMTLNILNQEKLWLKERFGGDWLYSLSATCKRREY